MAENELHGLMTRPTDAQRLAERVRPDGVPVMRQRWAQLLFLHWAWDPAAIQRTLPPGLVVDLRDGRAWLGLVPFFMQRVRPRGCPALPWISNFLEVNVRTYVHDAQGRPGVWFYSLDCDRWPAVEVARALFHLPYEHAAIRASTDGKTGMTAYKTRRRGMREEGESRFSWKPLEPRDQAAPGSLDFFLVERYRLFAQDVRRGQLYSGRVNHAPYQIGPVEVAQWDDTLLRLAGFDCEGRAPEHACAAPAVDVEIWPLKPVAAPAKAEDELAGELGEGMPA